jgi:hypothetical protein
MRPAFKLVVFFEAIVLKAPVFDISRTESVGTLGSFNGCLSLRTPNTIDGAAIEALFLQTPL